MSILEIKEEAIKQFALKVERINDEASLNVILAFLDGIGNSGNDPLSLSKHYESIKSKYGSVLERLAK